MGTLTNNEIIHFHPRPYHHPRHGPQASLPFRSRTSAPQGPDCRWPRDYSSERIPRHLIGPGRRRRPCLPSCQPSLSSSSNQSPAMPQLLEKTPFTCWPIRRQTSPARTQSASNYSTSEELTSKKTDGSPIWSTMSAVASITCSGFSDKNSITAPPFPPCSMLSTILSKILLKITLESTLTTIHLITSCA